MKSILFLLADNFTAYFSKLLKLPSWMENKTAERGSLEKQAPGVSLVLT